MAKLRLVQERRSATQEYDQDLRGLMDDPLLTGPMVYPVLSCSTEKQTLFADPNITNLITEQFNCRIFDDQAAKGTIHIVFHDQRLMTPKLQTLRLFYLGITLSTLCKGSDLSVCLWEAKPFEKKMKQSANQENYDQGLNPSAFFRPEILRKDALFTVHYPNTKYLQQSGVEGIANDMNEKVFDSRSLASALKIAQPELSLKRRAGGE